MPLIPEVHMPALGGAIPCVEWVETGRVNPGDRPGSISNNKPNGGRDVYLFECFSDDSKSVIYRSLGGVDRPRGVRRVMDIIGVKVVVELRRGQSYEMEVKTDKSPAQRKIRLRHI